MPSVQEKNLAAPPPHVWLRGRDGERGRGNNEAGEKWKTDVIIIEKKYFTSTEGGRDGEKGGEMPTLLAAALPRLWSRRMSGRAGREGYFPPQFRQNCASLSLSLSPSLRAFVFFVLSCLVSSHPSFPSFVVVVVVSLSTGENDP